MAGCNPSYGYVMTVNSWQERAMGRLPAPAILGLIAPNMLFLWTFARSRATHTQRADAAVNAAGPAVSHPVRRTVGNLSPCVTDRPVAAGRVGLPAARDRTRAARVGGEHVLQPAVALERPIEKQAGHGHQRENGRISPGLAQFRHVLEVHSVDSCQGGGDGGDRHPGADPAHVLVLRDGELGQGGLQNRREQLVEVRDALTDLFKVVGDVPEVPPHGHVDHARAVRGERAQRPGQRLDGVLELQQLPFHLVGGFRGRSAFAPEHSGLDLVDVDLDLFHRVHVVVHDAVADRVQHRGGTVPQHLRGGLQPAPQLRHLAMLAVAHRHDEVLTEKDHDLSGGDDLRGSGDLRVGDVGRRLEHHEQVVLVVLQLGPLPAGDRVLHGEQVQPILLGDRHELLVGRLEQAEPGEAVALRPGQAQRVAVVDLRRHPLPVAVDAAGHHPAVRGRRDLDPPGPAALAADPHQRHRRPAQRAGQAVRVRRGVFQGVEDGMLLAPPGPRRTPARRTPARRTPARLVRAGLVRAGLVRAGRGRAVTGWLRPRRVRVRVRVRVRRVVSHARLFPSLFPRCPTGLTRSDLTWA
ncbi:hypothetical protein FRACA_440018 [Frankia canadensis]|uniref:Uncharacterized protein n=1 Tax=Frankia canadensis TaxID=1836972 RepID=A0A2I2KXC9_9ACTN|nr:hypothetical protein FRACA_440018 [Frankia canadensis]SOU57610.1 hypothetical protein FRACA_440018 [Frankia canadensis]